MKRWNKEKTIHDECGDDIISQQGFWPFLAKPETKPPQTSVEITNLDLAVWPGSQTKLNWFESPNHQKCGKFVEAYQNVDICLLYHHSDRKSTRLNSSHSGESRMPSSA